MFITARKAYSTLCLSSAWELTWFVTGPTAKTVWVRLCEAVPPLLNYCKNCLYACEGIGMHSGSENDQPCGRQARFFTGCPDWIDALDTWGTGRNKLALHESYVCSSKNIVYWFVHLPESSKHCWGGRKNKKKKWKPLPQRCNKEFKNLWMFYRQDKAKRYKRSLWGNTSDSLKKYLIVLIFIVQRLVRRLRLVYWMDLDICTYTQRGRRLSSS